MVTKPQRSETHDFIAVKTRVGIKPLCLVHHKEMSALDDAGWFSCDEPGCEWHWRAASEYECYTSPGAVPYVGKKFQELVACQRPGHGHMFVWAFDPTTEIEVWQCSAEECREQKEREPRNPDSEAILHYNQHLTNRGLECFKVTIGS